MKGVSALASAVLLSTIILAGVYYIAVPSAYNSQPARPLPISRGHDLTIIARYEVPLTVAETMVGFKISLPRVLPVGLIVASVRVVPYPQGGLVYVFFASESLKGIDISLQQIIQSGGIILIQHRDNDDPTARIVSMVQQNRGQLQATSVNGHPGIMGGNVEHQIHWWADSIHFNLITNLKVPLDVLVKIAESTS